MCARFARPKGVAEVLPDGHFNLLINISFPKIVGVGGGGGGGGWEKNVSDIPFFSNFRTNVP